MVTKAREMEEMYGHYFDKTIVNTDLERTFDELKQAIDKLDVEPQWVPAFWVNDNRGNLQKKSHGHQLEINGVWRDDTLCYTNEKEQKKIHYRFVLWKEGIFF